MIDLLIALKRIRIECKRQTNGCIECPLRMYENDCRCAIQNCAPVDWDLVDNIPSFFKKGENE